MWIPNPFMTLLPSLWILPIPALGKKFYYQSYYSKAWAVILQSVATAMDAKDPHILAAMDGKEVNTKNPQPISTADRKEPTAFFFVIFGLVYEALSTASADASDIAAGELAKELESMKIVFLNDKGDVFQACSMVSRVKMDVIHFKSSNPFSIYFIFLIQPLGI
jgi:hypothetical protein